MSRAAVIALVALAATSCSGSGADKAGGSRDGKPVVLTLAVHDSGYAAEQFAESVARLSGRSVRIDVRSGWRSPEVEYEKGTIEDVRRGKVDLADVGVRVWDTVGVRSFRPLVAPMFIDSLELQRRIVESPLSARMLDGVEPLGLVGVALLPGALRRPLGVTHPLVRPEDYQGRTIGIRPGGVARATFAALGARAEAHAPIAGSILRMDGAELDLWTIESNRYDLNARALTANVVLWPRTETIVVNRGVFEALTPAQRDLLRRAGREAIEPAFARIREGEAGALATVCREGRLSFVRASAYELAALREAVRPVHAALERDPLIREVMAGIEKLRRTERSRAIDSVACRGSLAADAAAAALEGLWRVSLSRGELLAAGFAAEDAESNRGEHTLELRDGRFEYRIPRIDHVSRGTYRVRGQIVDYEVEACRPASTCTPGLAAGSYAWSVYRDRLTFRRIRGRPSVPNLIVEPLTRVG